MAEQSHKKMKKMQQRYNQAVADMEALNDLEKRLEQIHFNLKQLKKYYTSDWLNDRDQLMEEDKSNFTIIEEDTIYNLIAEHYKVSKKIIKKLLEEL